MESLNEIPLSLPISYVEYEIDCSKVKGDLIWNQRINTVLAHRIYTFLVIG